MHGLGIEHWYRLFWECHEASGFGGLHRVAWPDGGSLMDQPGIVVSMFELIYGEAVAALTRKTE